jgi:hypothetical protein
MKQTISILCDAPQQRRVVLAEPPDRRARIQLRVVPDMDPELRLRLEDLQPQIGIALRADFRDVPDLESRLPW